MSKQLRPVSMSLVLLIPLLLPGIGCKSASITEINGKSSFGPEFRNFGNNTHDIRYTAIQAVELKLSNKWTVGASFQRRDVDEGSGDNENAILFEVGYPIWNKPKGPEKTAEEIQIDELENELRQLGNELAAAENPTSSGTVTGLAQAGNVPRQP